MLNFGILLLDAETFWPRAHRYFTCDIFRERALCRPEFSSSPRILIREVVLPKPVQGRNFLPCHFCQPELPSPRRQLEGEDEGQGEVKVWLWVCTHTFTLTPSRLAPLSCCTSGRLQFALFGAVPPVPPTTL